MEIMWTMKAIILLLASFTCSSAVSNFQCARYCKEENGSFGYQAGKAYVYKYSGSARSLVNTTVNNVPDQSGINIDCTVVFRLVSNCDYVMEILDTTISDFHIKNSIKLSSTHQKFVHLESALKERPLHFAYNGKIDTICPDKSEIKEIIDIKRGILSIFQNSNPQFKQNALVYETDITGNCETHYKVTTIEGIKHVNKTKNLDACDHRMSQYLSWQTVPYLTNANSKSLPLLKSTLNCGLNYGPTDDTSGDILHDSNCYEKHVFQPFANGDNGAVTAIEQSMKFVRVEDSYKVFNRPKDVKRSGLIYEYNAEDAVLKDSMAAVMLLKELESKTADVVDMDVPSVFSKLVLEFQGLSKTSLLEIFNKINQKQRQFYIDAISLVTTTAGIEVMSELYEYKKLDDTQMNTWLVSVNFIKNPSKNILKVVYPLTLQPAIRQNAMLALSSVLYKYCNKQSNCLEDVVILEMVKNIEKPLINNCLITSNFSKKEIFLALKSIGNAGITTSFYNLQSCYINNELSVELRLAAIAAHRRMKCADNENLDDFKALFANTRANSEVRIASYLASMQCASYASFAQVKDVLVKEEANQVGSFIWTHLTNLQETSIPWKQGIRKLLENNFLQNKFHTDIRKYSRNYEASTFLDSVGVGGGIEANVIFTSESYLPRSAMLNFTLDLFGESINVLELGARGEGFEDIVENLFANDGYFPDGNVHSFISNAKMGYEKQQRIDEFGEVFKVLPKDPSGSIYAKIFGNELSFAQFNNLQDLFGVPNSGKEAMDILMKFIKQSDIDYTKSFSFLDAKYKIPTIIGFPMQLKANGTATVGLTAGGEIDLKELRSYKMLVRGKVYPSVSVQITGTMSMDTYIGETGVQYIGSLKSNMYIDGYANVEMGKIVDIKINVPNKQMDIFTVASDVYVIHNEHSYPLQDSSTHVDNIEYCTAGYISKLMGLQFCNQWRSVNASSSLGTPNFPLTGSFKYSTHIKKTDIFDFYQLYLETQLTNPEGQYLINFVLDTPNSNIDRKLQCLLAADLQAYKVSAHVYSPFANFQLESHIEREMPKYKFTLTTMFNNKEVVALMSTFDVRDEGDMVTYEPLAKINYKQQQIVAVTGKLSHIKEGEYRADLKLEGLTKEVAQIYGSFSCGIDYLQVKTNIMSATFKGDLDAILRAKANEVILESLLNYNYRNNMQENVSFVGRYNKSNTLNLSTNMMSLVFQSSEWPKYYTHLQWQNQRGPLYFNNTAEVKFFDTTWSSQQIIKLDKGFQDDNPDIVLLADLTSPENNIDYRSELSLNSSKTHLRTRVLFQLNPVQRAEAFIDYKANRTEDTIHILIYYARQTWIMDGELNRRSQGMYNFDVDCRYTAFDKEHVILTMHGDYRNASLGDIQSHKLNFTVDLPESGGEWRTPWIIASSVQKSQATFLSQSKVSTKEDDYAGHLNWIEDALAISLHANDKPLFVVNGARSDELISVALALNIHQHFELNAKLLLPHQRFDLQIYWDKDRDENQRFVFSIEQNVFKGQYNMAIEYPNQKIITNVILIPTQVIMNVTWGVEVSQRIYLKMGSKYYDIGGIYFGELETPFRYLEKQKFHLQYAVVSDSFDVQSELSWRSHHINLLIAGSRSNTHLNGNLQLNTTLPEIRKVGATLSHAHNINDNDYRSDAAFDYNDHSIRAYSNWRMTGYRVDSTFRVDSPTNTISPVFGILTLNDDTHGDDPNDMRFVLSWQEKNITASYTFKSDASSIEIDTPFAGVEHTLLKYTVITHADTVFFSTVVDIFKQNNSITFSWTNAEEDTSFWLELMSPMTGRYYGYFTHSGLLGRLKENFRIQGPENEDIIQMKIEGDIMPVLEMNVTASLVLLDLNAQLTITNGHEPLVSAIVAVWNDRVIDSKIRINFNDTSLSYFNWLIESNLFGPVNISFEEDNSDCVIAIQLPNDYKLVNRYTNSMDTFGIHNQFSLRTPDIILVSDLNTIGNSLNQHLLVDLDDRRVNLGFNVSLDELSGNLTYIFYQNDDILHSYNISSYSNPEGGITFLIKSTSHVNGRVIIDYKAGSISTDNYFKAKINFPKYFEYEFVAKQGMIHWCDSLKRKSVELTYRCTEELFGLKVTSSYEEFPSGELQLTYSKDLTGNLKLEIKKKSNQLAHITMSFKDVKQFNASVMVNTNMKYDSSFSYYASEEMFEILSQTKWHSNQLKYHSMYTTNNLKKAVIVEFQFNENIYLSKIQLDDDNLNIRLKHPDDEYIGKFSYGSSTITEYELSSRTSMNYFKHVHTIEGQTLTALSQFFNIPKQEILITWDKMSWIGGEGTYTNGDMKTQKFFFSPESFILYYPNDTIQAMVNASLDSNGVYKIKGNWENGKWEFLLEKYMGVSNRLAFNIVTPLKAWSRIALDYTLNARKIGLSIVVNTQEFSILAMHTGGEHLRIEYLGETLLEFSSSEGHMTLRTTSYLGKYRLFIQGTQTPGIYVFSILKNGENLISFMLQNYSINDVLHYKGKLIAPEFMPQNATLSVEFRAHRQIWRLLEFKMKKDHRPLLELAWANTKLEMGHGFDGWFLFQSQIDNLPKFKLQPIVRTIAITDFLIDLVYSCEGHEECSFVIGLNSKRLTCRSVSSVPNMNFIIESHFLNASDSISADFKFTVLKSSNIEINATYKYSDHMKVHSLVNVGNQSSEIHFDFDQNTIEIGVITNKTYALAKGQFYYDHLLVDLQLPPTKLFNGNITSKGNISIRNGLITLSMDKDLYEASWYTKNFLEKDMQELSAVFKENEKQIGDVSFKHNFTKDVSIQSDTSLHATYLDQTIDTFFKVIFSDNNINVAFTLLSPFEPIKNVNFLTELYHSKNKWVFEQFLQLPTDEFILNATAIAHSDKRYTLEFQCKPFNSSFSNTTIITSNMWHSDNYQENGYAEFMFEFYLGDLYYKINAQQQEEDGYGITFDVNHTQTNYITFKKNSLECGIENLGIFGKVIVDLKPDEILVLSRSHDYEMMFFAYQGGFGMILEKGKSHNDKSEWVIIYKMPENHRYQYHFRPYDITFYINDKNLNQKIDFNWDMTDSNVYGNLELQDKDNYLNATFVGNNKEYKFYMANNEESLGTFVLSKNFTKITNNIYMPFEIESVYNMSLHMGTSMVNLTFASDQRLVSIKFDEDQRFLFDFNSKSLTTHYQLNGQKFDFIIHDSLILEVNLNDQISGKYNLRDRFQINFNYTINNQQIKYNLYAKSIGNITFSMETDNDTNILLRSYFDKSCIMYHIKAPGSKHLRLFDVALSWETNKNKTDKLFGASVQLDSDHTGMTKAGAIFKLQNDLLDIESHFAVPFLEGYETFYGKVYLPKNFQPFVEFSLPQQTYKLYYVNIDNVQKAGVVCRNYKVEYKKIGNSDINIDLVLPNETLKTFFFKGNKHIVDVRINDEYGIILPINMTFIKLWMPYPGYEEFGYRFELTQETDNSSRYDLAIFCPEYSPLSVDLSYSLHENTFNVNYSIQAPFAINGFQHCLVNISTEIYPNNIHMKMDALSNNLDIGFVLGYSFSETKTIAIGQAHVNDDFYLGKFDFEPSKITIIIGDPHRKEIKLLETFPNFDNYVSSRLQMLYLSWGQGNIEILAHNTYQPLSIRHHKHIGGKIIWDLRRPTKTSIGAKMDSGLMEICLIDNIITCTNYVNGTNINLNINCQWNGRGFKYISKSNQEQEQRHDQNHTSIELQTPFGGLKYVNRTYSDSNSLSNTIELDWGLITNKPKLSFHYHISPGVFESSLSSPLLPHDVIFKVDMSKFRLIPSFFEVKLAYSSNIDKLIQFQMFYNNSFENDSVMTDRSFVLRHPTSKIDYNVMFHTVRMSESSNGSVILNYMDYDTNQYENMRASMRVDHNRFGVHGEVVTTKNRLHFMGTSTSASKRYGLLVNIEINDKDPLNLECNYDFGHENPSASLMAAYGTSRKYVFYAGLPNEKEITAKLGHEIYGKASLDALAIVKLNTSQLLWVKILWKDNLYAPFHEAILDEYNDLRYVIEATGRQLIDVIHDDVGKEFVKDIVDIKQGIVDYTLVEANNSLKMFFAEETMCNSYDQTFLCQIFLSDGFRELREYYKDNLKFLQDAIRMTIESSFKLVKVIFDALNMEMERAMKDIKNIQNIKVDAKTILKRGINTARKSLKEMESVVVQLLDEFDKYISNLQDQIEDFFEPFLSLVDDFIAYCEQRLSMLQIGIFDTLDSIQHYIFNLREIKAMFSVYYSYINWLEELHIIDMLEPIGDVIEEILETIIKDVKRVLDHYKPYLDALGDAIFGKYDGINQLPPIIEVREHVNRIYHKTIWVWNYHNMTEGLKQGVKKFIRDVDSVLSFIEVDELSSSEDLEYHLGYNYVIRPENRFIEISQPLPVEWKAFNKSPSFEHYPLYQKIQGNAEQFIKFYKSRYDFIDMLENFVIDLYEPSISPSMRNYAMIIGKTHYTTFNGLNYNFLSNCSYLLASDFKSKSFSLIVNYRNNSGVIDKSYEILTNGNSYEIFSEELVMVNAKKVDLPIAQKQVTITRENKNIIAESTRGFKLICYFYYDYCTVQLSGWLFGKTAGLLGTLDNEQHTDSLSSRRLPSPNIKEFLHSWQLQPECEIIEPPNMQPIVTEYVSHLCDLLFNDKHSPLEACFDAVEPTPFAEMCVNEIRANPKVEVCAPAAAYVHRCRQAKVTINMPDFCVTCEGGFGYSKEILDGRNNKTVDVVFITELDCYNATRVTNQLPQLLDQNLNRMGFRGNRYASVGYGGNTLPKPHVYTHNGKVWTSSKAINIKLQLDERNLNVRSKFTAIDAMKYAANFEYRLGVPKLFVLTQCEIATDVSNSPDIYNMLGIKDITLHVLKPSPYGNQTEITGLNMNELLPTTSRFEVTHNQIINEIDDVYSGLALSTNGTLFDLRKVYEDKTSAKMWARTIAKPLQRSPCQKCRCTEDFNGVGKIECTRCLAPAVKQFLNEYEKGNKMKFNDGDDSDESA